MYVYLAVLLSVSVLFLGRHYIILTAWLYLLFWRHSGNQAYCVTIIKKDEKKWDYRTANTYPLQSRL